MSCEHTERFLEDKLEEAISEMLEAVVQIKNIYGNERIIPINEKAQLLAKIAGTKTLTRETIDLAKSLGFTFIVQQETI